MDKTQYNEITEKIISVLEDYDLTYTESVDILRNVRETLGNIIISSNSLKSD